MGRVRYYMGHVREYTDCVRRDAELQMKSETQETLVFINFKIQFSLIAIL